MEPHNHVINAKWVVYRDNGNIDYQGDDPYYVDTLDCLTPNVRGDFVHPNPHWWTSFRSFNYAGRVRRVWDLNPSLNATQVGRLPASVAASVQPPSYQEAYDIAYGALTENLRGDVDLSVDFAEAGQSAALFKNIHKAERYLKGWTPAGIASRYLEFTFGWRPLANSIYGAADELTRAHFNVVETIKGQSYLKCDSSNTRRVSFGVASADAQETSKTSRFVRISVCLNPERSVDELSRWTSLNPVTTAWELFPYSFVVDWIYDVGGYLRNLETAFLASSRFRHGYVSTGTSSSYTGVALPTSSDPPYLVLADARSSCVVRTFSRTPLLSYPLPRSPRLRVKLGSDQLLSLGALAVQRLN